METTQAISLSKQQLQILDSVADEETLEEFGRQLGFLVRKARKLTAGLFVRAYVVAATLPYATLRPVAIVIGLLGGFTFSKQALSKRLDAAAPKLLEVFLARLLGERAAPAQILDQSILGRFARVVIQDSTTIKLPAKWAGMFPGSKNQHRQQGAQMKIQALLDLKAHRFINFLITPFTSNDQRAASEALEHVRAGDLWIRDLGYFTLGSLRGIADVGAQFLSRFRFATSIIDQCGQPLELMDILRGNDRVDRRVLLGQKARLPVRLLAVRLPEAVAAERRRKALADRDKRLNPGKRRLQALGWTIYITNAPKGFMSLDDALRLYAMRWRIEIIFKSWKRHFQMKAIPLEAAPCQLLCLLLGRLIFCALFEVFLTQAWRNDSAQAPPLSHLKTAQFFKLIALNMPALLPDALPPEALKSQLDYHCRYEKRRRPNMIEKFNSLG